MIANHDAVLHVRFDGRSIDLPLRELDLGPRSDDADILEAVAAHLKVRRNGLRGHVVDRHRTGNLTVRPQAVFG